MKKKIIGAGMGAAALCLLIAALWLVYILNTLPDISVIKHYRPPAAAEVFDRSGRLLTAYHDRALRFWVTRTALSTRRSGKPSAPRPRSAASPSRNRSSSRSTR